MTTQTPSPSGSTPETIAGQIPLNEVFAQLRARSTVFHSEADLQYAFARTLWEVAPEIRSRLEVPMRGPDRTEYLELMCLGSAARTAIGAGQVVRYEVTPNYDGPRTVPKSFSMTAQGMYLNGNPGISFSDTIPNLMLTGPQGSNLFTNLGMVVHSQTGPPVPTAGTP